MILLAFLRREVRFFEAEYLVAVTIILLDAKTVKSRLSCLFLLKSFILR